MDHQTRLLVSISLFVIVMCAIASVYMTSCDSTFLRQWQSQFSLIGPGSPALISLKTTRIHSPSGRGKFGKEDEVRYEVEVRPVRDAFSESDLKFLDAQTKREPHLNIISQETHLVLADEPLKLELINQDGAFYYKAKGIFPATQHFRSDDKWNVLWDMGATAEAPPTVPGGKQRLNPQLPTNQPAKPNNAQPSTTPPTKPGPTNSRGDAMPRPVTQ